MYAVHATSRSRLATTPAEATSDRRFLHLARYRFPNGRLWRPAPVAAEPDSLIRSATRVPERRHVASLTGRVLGEEERRLEYGLERASVQGSDNTALFLREGERETDPASRAEPRGGNVAKPTHFSFRLRREAAPPPDQSTRMNGAG